jgi:hypothetical protein
LRNKEEIINKANELFQAAMGEFIESRTCKNFKNCKHNSCISVRKLGRINYCSLKTKVDGNNDDRLFVCDTNEWSAKCEEFESNRTKESSKKEFMEIVSDPSRCGHVFPKLSTLLWAVNSENKEESTVNSVHGHEEYENRVDLNWFQRMLKRLFF